LLLTEFAALSRFFFIDLYKRCLPPNNFQKLGQ